MSRASLAPTSRFGIAVPGETCCGSRIQCLHVRRRVGEVTADDHAQRDLRRAAGRPCPSALRTFFNAWQLPQPYWMNIASPRQGRPS